MCKVCASNVDSSVISRLAVKRIQKQLSGRVLYSLPNMLPLRKCGNQGFECLAQGLGCMSMSAFYSGFDSEEARAESLRVLDKAAEMEGIMLDTSDVYGPFTNEQLICKGVLHIVGLMCLLGKAIAGRRDKFKIATKCGIIIEPDKPIAVNSSPEHVKKSCQGK